MNLVTDCEIVDLPKIHNTAGNITALNNLQDIPFEVKRIYFLYDVPMGAERGGHAHFELEQYVVAASGSFIFVLDDGINKREIFLNNPAKALHIKKGIWREMKDFSSGSVCLVLASNAYKEDDYIRDYKDFLNFRKLMRVDFVEYDRLVLEKSWNWLNDQEIKNLTSTAVFTKEEQAIWFESLASRSDYFVKGIEYDSNIIGVVGLKHIDLLKLEAEYFGYIGVKEMWGKGLSKVILQKIVKIAKQEFGLNSLYLNVIPQNERAIKAYLNFGFTISETLHGNIKMDFGL